MENFRYMPSQAPAPENRGLVTTWSSFQYPDKVQVSDPPLQSVPERQDENATQYRPEVPRMMKARYGSAQYHMVSVMMDIVDRSAGALRFPPDYVERYQATYDERSGVTHLTVNKYENPTSVYMGGERNMHNKDVPGRDISQRPLTVIKHEGSVRFSDGETARNVKRGSVDATGSRQTVRIEVATTDIMCRIRFKDDKGGEILRTTTGKGGSYKDHQEKVKGDYSLMFLSDSTPIEGGFSFLVTVEDAVVQWVIESISEEYEVVHCVYDETLNRLSLKVKGMLLSRWGDKDVTPDLYVIGDDYLEVFNGMQPLAAEIYGKWTRGRGIAYLLQGDGTFTLTWPERDRYNLEMDADVLKNIMDVFLDCGRSLDFSFSYLASRVFSPTSLIEGDSDDMRFGSAIDVLGGSLDEAWTQQDSIPSIASSPSTMAYSYGVAYEPDLDRLVSELPFLIGQKGGLRFLEALFSLLGIPRHISAFMEGVYTVDPSMEMSSDLQEYMGRELVQSDLYDPRNMLSVCSSDGTASPLLYDEVDDFMKKVGISAVSGEEVFQFLSACPVSLRQYVGSMLEGIGFVGRSLRNPGFMVPKYSFLKGVDESCAHGGGYVRSVPSDCGGGNTDCVVEGHPFPAPEDFNINFGAVSEDGTLPGGSGLMWTGSTVPMEDVHVVTAKVPFTSEGGTLSLRVYGQGSAYHDCEYRITLGFNAQPTVRADYEVAGRVGVPTVEAVYSMAGEMTLYVMYGRAVTVTIEVDTICPLMVDCIVESSRYEFEYSLREGEWTSMGVVVEYGETALRYREGGIRPSFRYRRPEGGAWLVPAI